jgi:hypothetical protein
MNDATKLNIYQRMALVMDECPYIQKDTIVQGYKGVSRDGVVAAVRRVLLKNGVMAFTSQASVDGVVVGGYRDTPRTNEKDNKLTIYWGAYVTKFVNIENPSDLIEVQHAAEGQDYGDKAPGKAATYAEKLNFLKGLCLETGINTEERNPGETPQEPAPAPAIRAPKEKAAPAAEAEPAAEATPAAEPEDTSLASKGAIAMLTRDIEEKHLMPAVVTMLAKNKATLETLTRTRAKKLREWVARQPAWAGEREPGQEG